MCTASDSLLIEKGRFIENVLKIHHYVIRTTLYKYQTFVHQYHLCFHWMFCCMLS